VRLVQISRDDEPLLILGKRGIGIHQLDSFSTGSTYWLENPNRFLVILVGFINRELLCILWEYVGLRSYIIFFAIDLLHFVDILPKQILSSNNMGVREMVDSLELIDLSQALTRDIACPQEIPIITRISYNKPIFLTAIHQRVVNISAFMNLQNHILGRSLILL